MKIIKHTIGEHALLTGYIHELSPEMENIVAFPAILVLPGGGFRFCSEREGEPVAMAFYAEGYSAFVLNYTTVTKKADATINDPMNDCNSAMSWIRQHAGKMHLSQDKLAVIGFSAGGHLAAAVSTHGPERPNLLLLGYSGIFPNRVRALICPDILERVDGNTPPSFIFATCDDAVVKPADSLSFAQALDKAGVEYELHIFGHGAHGLSLGKAMTSAGERDLFNERFAQWFPMAIQWMREKWGEFTVYGVNDGRNGRFSIDTKLGTLMADDGAVSVIKKYIPTVSQLAAQYSSMADTNIRSFVKWGYPLPLETLKKLDAELLAL